MLPGEDMEVRFQFVCFVRRRIEKEEDEKNGEEEGRQGDEVEK